MYTSLFLCADYANLTGDGKLNIMGIFSTIFATQFPARHPSMHIIAKLIGGLGEEGQTRMCGFYYLDPKDNASLKLVVKCRYLSALMPKSPRSTPLSACTMSSFLPQDLTISF